MDHSQNYAVDIIAPFLKIDASPSKKKNVQKIGHFFNSVDLPMGRGRD